MTASGRKFTAAELAERAIHRRAVEAAIWGMPAVNYHLMYQEMVDKVQGRLQPGPLLVAPAGLEEPDAHAEPRRDLPHAVLQHEGRRSGGAGDSARRRRRVQRQHHELLAGRDRGRRAGRRGQGQGRQVPVPAAGLSTRPRCPTATSPMPSDTYQGYALLRSVLKSGSDADVAKAVTYAKRLKLYPLSQAANPPPTTFVDASDVDVRLHHPLRPDASSSRSIEMVQAEPWLERDKAMIDPLKTIGIERGKPFKPDAKTQADSQRRDPGGEGLVRRQVRHVAALLRRRALVLPDHRGNAPQRHERLADAGFLSDRRPRHRLHARLLQRQASGGVPVLSADRQRQGREAAGRQDHLSPERAGERPGHAVLVDDRLQPRHARLHPERHAGGSLVAVAGTARRTPTVRRTSTSARRRRRARNRTGSRPIRTAASRCSPASTVRRSRCSTRRGSCRTSRKRAETMAQSAKQGVDPMRTHFSR